VVMPTLGWIGGRLGNRGLYLGSLSLYVITSMLCGLAWDLESMIFFRVLQGMSAGYLFPLAMTILHETYPPDKRGMAMGIFMAGMSFGPAIGAVPRWLADRSSELARRVLYQLAYWSRGLSGSSAHLTG